MITLRCYEPAGRVLSLSANDLCRHVLAIGSTGSGKTTGLVNPLLRQLIRWKSDCQSSAVGILVLDAKGDDTVQKITEYAREAGREHDVVALSDINNTYYDFFGNFQDLNQVDEFTNRVLMGTRDLGDQNVYWTESRYGLVQSALILLLAGGSFDFEQAAEFLSAFCFDRKSKLVENRLNFVKRLLGDTRLHSSTRRRLELVLIETQNWYALDDRTREIHRSAMANALRHLLTPAARWLFDSSRGVRFDPTSVLQGRILVCSVNALATPQLAMLLFRALKRDFYSAVLSRRILDSQADRLCGIILDELPLAVTPEDSDVLPVLRSKGGFVVASTQGLSALDDVIGRRKRDTLLTNFCSNFIFSGRESQSDEFAMLTLGSADEKAQKSEGHTDAGDIHILDPAPTWNSRPICPPGALTRLKPHESYVKLAHGEVTRTPCWLEPVFHNFPRQEPFRIVRDLAEAVERLHLKDRENSMSSIVPAILLKHMHQQGHKLMSTADLVFATWQLCIPSVSRASLIKSISERAPIKGLENLPSCWLLGLLRWLEKQPALAPTVAEVSHHAGMLWLRLDDAASKWGEGPILIPAEVNLFVYPSLWRPILRNHSKTLFNERPDLRSQLVSLPQNLIAGAENPPAHNGNS